MEYTDYAQDSPKAHPGTNDAGLCTRCGLKPLGDDYAEKENECPPGFWMSKRVDLDPGRLDRIADLKADGKTLQEIREHLARS